MSAEPSSLVRVMSEEAILRICPVLPYCTSVKLNWAGVEVHRYRFAEAFTSKQFALPQLAIFLPHVSTPYKGWQTVGDDTCVREINNDVITIAPPDFNRRVWNGQPDELTVIFLNSLVFSEIARAETGLHYPEIAPQFAIADPLIRSIGMQLDEEMRSHNPKPASYCETLAAALASHIFANYAKPVYREMRSFGPNWPQLRRSIEHIHEHPDKHISLDDLALVANMSKFHFAKSFREAMGIAPHQYLVQLRVEKARKLLADPSLSIPAVASRVGYTDSGQFSAQFRRIVGSSPKQYQRGAGLRHGLPKPGKLGN